MHMQEVKGMEDRQGELAALVEGQQWKLWLAGAMLAVAGASFLMPDGIGRTLDVPGVAVQLGAMVLCFASLGWAIWSPLAPRNNTRERCSRYQAGKWKSPYCLS